MAPILYVRIIRGQTQPGQVAEAARRWEAFISPTLRATPGFRHVYFAGNTEADALVAVSLWDAPPDAELFNQAVRAFTDQERALLRGQLTIEDYEVLDEVTG